MGQHHSLESEIPEASQDIPYILLNLKTHYNVHIKSSTFPPHVSS